MCFVLLGIVFLDRRRHEEANRQLQPQPAFQLMPYNPVSLYAHQAPNLFAFMPNRFEDVTNARTASPNNQVVAAVPNAPASGDQPLQTIPPNQA